jgi:hypothetical protein
MNPHAHNPRVQLIATAFNNLGVGSMLAGIVAPVVTGAAGGWLRFGAWFAVGVLFLTLAQIILGRLRP